MTPVSSTEAPSWSTAVTTKFVGDRDGIACPFYDSIRLVFIVWSVLAYFVTWPWTLRLTAEMRLRFWIAPQMFRALGLGLLVPLLSPGLSTTFAIPTAAVDFFTAILAVLAFVGLYRGWRLALPLTWACTIIGLGDLLIAFSIAPFIGVADHLAAQWFIPAFVGPLMIVAHVACLAALLRSRSLS